MTLEQFVAHPDMIAMRKLRRIDSALLEIRQQTSRFNRMILLYEPMAVASSQIESVNRPHLFDVAERLRAERRFAFERVQGDPLEEIA